MTPLMSIRAARTYFSPRVVGGLGVRMESNVNPRKFEVEIGFSLQACFAIEFVLDGKLEPKLKKAYKGLQLIFCVFTPMNLKVVSNSENSVQILVDKEDYSIADILHRELLNLKHVKFAGVPLPHPLIKTLTIQVQTDGAEPTKLIKEALEAAQSNVSELLAIARENFPKIKKEPPEGGRSVSYEVGSESEGIASPESDHSSS